MLYTIPLTNPEPHATVFNYYDNKLCVISCVKMPFGHVFTYDTYVKTVYDIYMKSGNVRKVKRFPANTSGCYVPHTKAVHRIK
jgi:hypothetical protein